MNTTKREKQVVQKDEHCESSSASSSFCSSSSSSEEECDVSVREGKYDKKCKAIVVPGKTKCYKKYYTTYEVVCEKECTKKFEWSYKQDHEGKWKRCEECVVPKDCPTKHHDDKHEDKHDDKHVKKDKKEKVAKKEKTAKKVEKK